MIASEECALNTRDLIYREIRKALMDGKYKDTDLLVPGVIGAEFQASRTPVREALSLLEHDGLLVQSTRGYRPRILSYEELLEVFHLRAVIESSAAGSAAQKRTDLDLAHLVETLDGRDENSRTGSTEAETRTRLNRWHEAVRIAAHNQTIVTALQRLDAQIRVSAPWTPLSTADSAACRPLEARIAEHRSIQAAIVARDAAAARELMQQHLDRDQDTRIRQLALSGPSE